MALVDEIAYLLGEQTVPAVPGREDTAMSWAAIIAIVLELVKQRAEAGWPVLKFLIDKFGWKIQEAADNDAEKITVGAAPDDVKNMIIAFLEKQKASAGVFMKGVYTLLIRFVPLIADQIVDSLFKAGHVSKPLSDFTPMLFSTGESEQDVCLS